MTTAKYAQKWQMIWMKKARDPSYNKITKINVNNDDTISIQFYIS